MKEQLGTITKNDQQHYVYEKNEERKLDLANKADGYNKDGWNVLTTSNNFNFDTGAITMKNMVWKFEFSDKQWERYKNNDSLNIESKEFWMSQFKNNKKVKSSFKKALNRKRGRYKQLAILVAGKTVWVVLCLGEKLQYLKKSAYMHYYSKFLKNIRININSSKIILKPVEQNIGLLMTVPLSKYHYQTLMETKIIKKHSLLFGLNSFKNAFSLTNKFSTGLTTTYQFFDKKTFNNICNNAHRKQSLAGQKVYKKSILAFNKKYKNTLFHGKKYCKAWLTKAATRYFQKQGDIFFNPPISNYGIKNAEKIRFSLKNDKIIIVHPEIKNKPEIKNFNFEDDGVYHNGKKMKPLNILKEFVLNPKLTEIFNFNRKEFLNYWDNNDEIKLQQRNIFLTWCLGLRSKGGVYNTKSNPSDWLENKAGMQNTHNALKKINNEFSSIQNKKQVSRQMTKLTKLYYWGQKSQNEYISQHPSLRKEQIISQGGTNGWVISPFKKISKNMGYNSKYSKQKLKELFGSCSTLHLKYKEPGYEEMKNIPVLDRIIFGNKQKIIEKIKEDKINIPGNGEDWFKKQHHKKEFVLFRFADSLNQQGAINMFSAMSCLNDNSAKLKDEKLWLLLFLNREAEKNELKFNIKKTKRQKILVQKIKNNLELNLRTIKRYFKSLHKNNFLVNYSFKTIKNKKYLFFKLK